MKAPPTIRGIVEPTRNGSTNDKAEYVPSVLEVRKDDGPSFKMPVIFCKMIDYKHPLV